ncbi:MAG: hypothetical protein AABY51_10025 [Deltaproteobacteria bacterium]
MIFLHESWADEQYRRQGGAVEPPPADTPWYKAAGMGLVRGAGDVMGAGVLAAGGIVGLMEGGLFEPHASDKVFKFYEDEVQPRKDYWTPDPQTVSGTGRLLGAISSVGFPLMLGPGAAPALIGSSTFSTAADLLESGVDPATATGIGIMSGVATGAAISLPAAGKTLPQTLGLIASNPVLGGVQAAAQGEVLKAKGYTQQAKSFDPYNLEARTIDLALGVVFGGLSHYGRERKAMPVQVEDAIDTAVIAQKTARNNPLNGVKNVMTHNEASNKAVDDILEGRPVDVSQVLKDVKPEDIKAAVVPGPEAVMLREAGDIALKASEDEAVMAMEGPKEPEISDFGPVFTQFKDKPQEAVKHLLEVKTGEAVGTLHHNSIGPIDLVWGKEGTPEKGYEDGYGLAKIVKKHPEVVGRLQGVIDEMGVKSKSANRAILESLDHKAVVRLDWNGETKHWLVSAYKRADTSHTEGSTYGSGSKGGEPTPSPQDVSNKNIPPSHGEVKTAGVSSKASEASAQADTPFAPKASVNASVEGLEANLKAAAQAVRDNPKSLDALRDFNNLVSSHPEAVDFDTYGRLWQKFYGEEAHPFIKATEKQKNMLDDPIEATGERILADNPDITYHAGTDETGEPVIRTAREVVDEARAEVQKAESVKDLFDMAVDCLRRG